MLFVACCRLAAHLWCWLRGDFGGVDCRSLFGCPLSVMCRSLFVVCCLLVSGVVCCSLIVGSLCVVNVVSCLMYIYILFYCCLLLSVVCCRLSVGCCLTVVCCMLVVV